MLTKDLMDKVIAKNPGEKEFHQAVSEVLESLEPVLKQRPEYLKAKILDRIVEPDRQIMFRVTWTDDNGSSPGQPRIQGPVQQCYRSVQGRSAPPPLRQPGHLEVPRFRTGVQELPHRSADGRRQGRFGFRPQGEERRRGHEVLPELHERAVPPYRPEHRCSCR